MCVLLTPEVGHLLGEYDGTGALIEETVWLGDIPSRRCDPTAPLLSKEDAMTKDNGGSPACECAFIASKAACRRQKTFRSRPIATASSLCSSTAAKSRRSKPIEGDPENVGPLFTDYCH